MAVPKAGSSRFQLLLWFGIAVSSTPVYLITWRIARRGRGLAVLAVAAAVIGPLRDYRVAAMFPDWIAFSPGFALVFAVATIYALLVVVGHGVMRIVSGSAQGDSFASLNDDPGGSDDTRESRAIRSLPVIFRSELLAATLCRH